MSNKVRVAIIGVGNCASSLVQGVEFYKKAKDEDKVPGLMHVNLGGYHIRDIEFSAAIDIDKNKVGKDLSEAIYTWPNCTYKFCDVPKSGIKVQRGMTHDGLGHYLSQIIEKAPGDTVDIVKLLKDTRTDVVVNYLPVGSEEATKWYVEQILDAGCGLVNCIPVFIAREAYWQKRFKERGLPVIGDDIKSQVGATIMHRILTRLFLERGVHLDRTSQLNVGGNTDFLNMLERSRLESKKISKTNAVTSQLDYEMSAEQHSHRTVGLRRMASGPEVGLHSYGRDHVRQRAAQRRAQDGSLGQPELGRCGYRRCSLLQAGSGQRPLGGPDRAVVVLQEVPAGSVHR